MQSRLPLAVRAATRSQRVSARSRPLACLRALATATADATTSTPSSSSPPPPITSIPTSTSPSDPALHRLVDDISSLTLLQASDLVTLLKSRLNIQEIALPTAGAAFPAGAGAGVGADDAGAGEEEVAAKPKEKTIFNVRLESFDAGAKPKVIKEVKALVPNLTLIEAKKFVESLPKVLKESIPKEDAEKIKKAFEVHGAVVILE